MCVKENTTCTGNKSTLISLLWLFSEMVSSLDGTIVAAVMVPYGQFAYLF